MVKLNQDFTMVSGDDRQLTFTVEDQDAGDGSPKNLTSATVKWKMQGVTVKSSTGADVTITSSTGGTFTVEINPADTALLKGVLRHEAEVTDSAGNKTTVALGHATIIPDITT